MEILLAIALVVGIVAGFSWLFWTLWCFVMPQIWVGGPENITQPSWLLFFCATVLISWIGRTIFGSRKA